MYTVSVCIYSTAQMQCRFARVQAIKSLPIKGCGTRHAREYSSHEVG